MPSETFIVKIHIAKFGLHKKFQVKADDRVESVIRQVQEKVPGTEHKPNENYGLFLENIEDPKKSHWLMNSKTMKFYDIQDGESLVYKDKTRYLKVKMLDETIKTVLVDDSKSIGHALDLICEKIGINTLNADEYALFIEEEKDHEMPDQVGTTLPRNSNAKKMDFSKKIMDKVDQLQEKKVATLKKKAHTDDDTNWLRNDKTLREAGVIDDSIVVIRRRYTYEKSVNITNPVEINLLYVQSRDAILDGSHPCSLEEATRFAAYQAQAQHGDFDEMRYKSHFIELKDFLPKECPKAKDTLRMVKEHHKKLTGITELDCKYKYIQLCQNLETYGVTVFVVKEKIKGKNKLVPRLFGVSRESCFRLDEKTKKVLQKWPLTTVKRWAASPTSFTLDFGDYKQGMYSVLTSEGTQICQLIGGYIDIILKRRKRLKMQANEGDDYGVIAEASNLPCRRITIGQHNFTHEKESIPRYAKHANIRGSMSKGQQALVNYLDTSGKAVLVLVDELNEEDHDGEPLYAELEPRREGEDTDNSDVDEEVLLSNLAAGIVSVVNKMSGPIENDDYTAIGDGVSLLTSNLKDLTHKIKIRVRSLKRGNEDENPLLNASKELAGAFSDFLKSVNPAEENADVVASVNKISKAFIRLRPPNKENEAFKVKVLKQVEGIEKASDCLMADTKEIAETLDPEGVMKLKTAVANTKQKVKQFSSSVHILMPYIHAPSSKEEISESVKLLNKDTSALAGLFAEVVDPDSPLKDRLQADLVKVGDMSEAFLEGIEQGAGKIAATSNIYNVLIDANDMFFKHNGQPDEMVKQSVIMGQVCAQLAKTMERQANNSEDKEKMLDAVVKLTNATSDLLNAAKAVKLDPNNIAKQEKLKMFVIQVKSVAKEVTGDAIKTARVVKLRGSALGMLKATSEMLMVANNAAEHNTNPAVVQKFKTTSTAFIHVNSKGLAAALKESENKPNNAIATRKLLLSSKYFIPAASKMIATSKEMLPTVTKNNAARQLSRAVLFAEKYSHEFALSTENASEGKDECDEMHNSVNKSMNDLDQASLSAINGQLQPTYKIPLKSLQEDIVRACTAAEQCSPRLLHAAQHTPQNIGPEILKLNDSLKTLSPVTISFASHLVMNPEEQMKMLELSKTVFESASQLVNSAKDCGGNEEADGFIDALIDANDNFKEAVNDLKDFATGVTDDMNSIETSIKRLTAHKQEVLHASVSSPNKTFPLYQSTMVDSLKKITHNVHDMIAKAHATPKELGEVCVNVSTNYGRFTEDVRYAAKLVNNELGSELLGNTEVLGEVCVRLVQSAGEFQVHPDDMVIKRGISEKAKDVSVKVASLMSSIHKSAVGTQECINAVDRLQALGFDLDTSTMFAEAGTLVPEDKVSFAHRRENLLSDVKKMTAATKLLVSAAPGSQQGLAAAVKEVMSSITDAVDGVKLSATSLGNEDVNGQVLLLNAMNAVTASLVNLVTSARDESGRQANDPSSSEALNGAAKHTAGKIATLLKTVQSVKNEASRGERAIEYTVEAIKQAVRTTQANTVHDKRSTPEDLVHATKGVTMATAKAVAAGNSLKQADIIEAANMGRKLCLEMMEVAQSAVCSADDYQIRDAVLMRVNETSQLFCAVLENVLLIQTKPELKQQLPVLSKKIAQSVALLVRSAEDLKGSDLVHPDDPNAIAEAELLEAASSIEAAATKLSQLQPKPKPKSANNDLNFEEQILEAAKAITSATGSLVRAAALAQRELVDLGLVCSVSSDNYADTQWSNGLISAARLVADATRSLCDSANAAVLGVASQDKLIASAKAVSSSTAQLLLACRVKADPYSKKQQGLQRAGNAVKMAADRLVKAAQEAAVFEVDVVDTVMRNRGARTNEFIEQIEAQEAILKKERELEIARKRLEKLREAKYAKEKQEMEEGATSF